MLLFIIRHGDPVYNPDSLTPLGHLQASAVAKRLALYGVDKLFASPLIRAQQTEQPTADLIKKEIVTLDWTSESFAAHCFFTQKEERNGWVYAKRRNEMRSPRIYKLGFEWYKDEVFDDTRSEEGYKHILDESDSFFKSLGYEHDREGFFYKPINENNDRVAVFCHEGFGLSWLGTLLDIPLPIIWSNFTVSHSNMTVIDFNSHGTDKVIPQVLTHSNDSHLYREGLPTKYQNSIYF